MSDRKLNEAVALAMGWTGPNRYKLWRNPATQCSGGPPPAYSTDPATQAEMISWLQERTGGLELLYWSGGSWQAVTMPPRTSPRCIPQTGATINEALARLVVAVAESEAKP